ncbi:transcriptional activator RinB [Staphylococcus saprophyticus]|uniref:transcriptional activator RinB n=1 Tax=Staphylococcus saprophyticus TaxID=29385 RepID=UPI00380AF77B
MIKHILKLLFTLAMYELGKYVTNVVIEHYRYREGEVDINTFNEQDHIDLKRIVAEVSE